MKKFLAKAGVLLLEYIENNIDAGIDYNNKPFQYSKKPYWRPYNENIINKMGGKAGKGKFYNITKSRNGKLGMVILGGYDEYKKIVNPQAYGNFLTSSGKMLRSMSVLKTNNKSVIIGFTGEENIKKAYYLNVSGAGKSRKLWKFLGITKKQKEELTELASSHLYELTRDVIAKISASVK